MARIAKRFGALTALVVVAGALQLMIPAASYAASTANLRGGSVAAVSGSPLMITGFCSVDLGTECHTNLTVAPGGELIAAFGGSDVHVGGNLTVRSNGVLILGCEPEAFVCFNDPDQVNGTLTTNDTIGGTSPPRARSP